MCGPLFKEYWCKAVEETENMESFWNREQTQGQSLTLLTVFKCIYKYNHSFVGFLQSSFDT